MRTLMTSNALFPALCSRQFLKSSIKSTESPFQLKTINILLRRKSVAASILLNAVSKPLVSEETDKAGSVERKELMKTGPTFQEAIAKLQEYWASAGCAVWLPHNTEVGAGTMNPATFLRVSGPEPWNVCYPEPSIRPDDSRYGKNPNRIQRHTQFQVILKPDPGNPQELYLQSLTALGIDSKKHDIRFVEDNWESPVLGAWGLGWEVWLDGMEVTQFTYFQQAGSIMLPVPAVEITYGLERILMSLQNVKHFKDIRYNDSITYEELFLQNEEEMSTYNLNEADIENHWKRFELYRKEAEMLLEKGLPIPAYDNLLKCSHAFNILDARGKVGVAERNTCFAAMRKLARDVTTCWVARRHEMGYPLLLLLSPKSDSLPKDGKSGSVTDSGIYYDENEKRAFVLEIGCEELPTDEVASAMSQMSKGIKALLKDLRLEFGMVKCWSTPRRLVVYVEQLQGKQESLEKKIKGPPAKTAYDADGKEQPALLGFCKRNNVLLDSVVIEKGPKDIDFVFGICREEGQYAVDILKASLPQLLSSVSFKKSMKWNAEETWSRPIRWILALHGEVKIPLSFARVTGGNTSRGLRNSLNQNFSISSAESYFEEIKNNFITLDKEERKEKIWTRAKELAAEKGGTLEETNIKDGLLDEVANLVESPNVILGSFSQGFLKIPEKILTTVMKKHQRYFPIYENDKKKKLFPFFVSVANGQIDIDTVRAGNEAVLRARFEDAQFFYSEDSKLRLEDFRPKLEGVVFEKHLGNLLQKCERTFKLIEPIASICDIPSAAVITALRAAYLYRADLSTSVVTEMTSLAGFIGKHYAERDGESVEVCQAIFESVLPRVSGDILPSSPPGILLSLSDKIDSLVGLVAAGRTPTSAADPYGLRRTAYGLLDCLIANKIDFSLKAAIDLAAEIQPVQVSSKAKHEVEEFLLRRLEQLFCDKGILIQSVRSVLSQRGDNPYLACESAIQLNEEMKDISHSSRLNRVLTTMSRPTRLTRGKEISKSVINTSLFEKNEEMALYEAFNKANDKIYESISIDEFLEICEELIEPIDRYFDVVFVMCEDKNVQMNRLIMLHEVAEISKGILDFAELPGF